jgi:hypothetical protein
VKEQFAKGTWQSTIHHENVDELWSWACFVDVDLTIHATAQLISYFNIICSTKCQFLDAQVVVQVSVLLTFGWFCYLKSFLIVLHCY